MNLAGWFVDTVTVASQSSIDGYGARSYGQQSTIKARVEGGTRLIRGTQGEERVSTKWFTTDQVVTNSQSFWLPGDSTGSEGRQPIRVLNATTRDTKTTLYVVYFE